jgi:hypothetical protein
MLRVAAVAGEPFEARAVTRLPDVHVGVGSFPRRVGECRLVGLTRQLRMIAILVDEQHASPIRHPVNQKIARNRSRRPWFAPRAHHDEWMSNMDA